MTLDFGSNEAVVYVGVATSTINAQLIGSGGLTKFGPNQLTLSGSNGGLTGGNITLNEGTLFLQNPVSNSGTGIGSVTGSRPIVLNGGTLVIDSLLSNNAGRDSNIVSGSRITGNIGSNVTVNADATITNNNQGIMQRINNLTIADLGANSPIFLNFSQQGITVAGTTTLGANSNIIGSTFGVATQTIFEGQVVGGANGKLIKVGNGGLTFANGTNTFGTDGQIGLDVWASTQNTATSVVISTSLTGTPFGAGDINLMPGTMIRLADASNIANQKVTAASDDWAISGVSFGYNNDGTRLTQANILDRLTTGAATDGKVQLTTTGANLGVIGLDNSWQYGALDMGAMETALNAGGPVERLWLGNMTSGVNNQVYFAPTLGASTDGVYRLGGGGTQGTLWIGFNAFENVLTGGNSVQIGAADGNAFNTPGLINGNGNITLNTRQNFTGGLTANRDSILNIGNNFALGSGTLAVNQSTTTGGSLSGSVVGGGSGALQTFSGAVSLNNPVDIAADLRWQGNGDLVFRGAVNLAPGGVAGTHVLEVGVGGQGAILGINGVISGTGSNLIKSGNQPLVLNGLNTYTGTTTITPSGTLPSTGTTFSGILVGNNVMPNTAGALGISDTPLLYSGPGTTGNSGGIGLSGQITFGRDILVQNTTDTTNVSIFGNSIYTAKLTGGVSIVTGGTNRITQFQALNSGRLELLGPITSLGAVNVRFGDGANPAVRGGVVYLGGDANGYSPNTYSGATFLDNARTIIGADALYTGPANALNIISGPFGSSTLLFGAGSNNGGSTLGSDGANRIIPNQLASMGTAANITTTFEGRGNLTFINTTNPGAGGSFNINSDASLRNRTFAVNTTQGAIQFDSELSASGAAGANLLKTGTGILILNGSNSVVNNSNTDANYGTSWFIDAGTLRVTNDAALGSTTVLAAAQSHLAGLPSDVRLRGGTLSVGGTFLTPRQFIQTAASTIEVSGSNTLTQGLPITGAFGLTKTSTGTLVLNATTNAFTSLTIGGIPSGGGMVSTAMGTAAGTQQPFGTGAVTLSGGTLQLTAVTGTAPVGTTVGTTQAAASHVLNVSSAAGIVPGMTISGTNIAANSIVTAVNGNNITLSLPTTGAATAATALTFGVANQALTVPTLTYNGGSVQLLKGTGVTSSLTATAFTRGTNGMMTVISSNLASDLGSNERFIPSVLTNTAGLLTSPSVVGLGLNDGNLNFLRYVDGTSGLALHNATTTGTLAVTAPTSLADILGGAQAVADSTISVRALRTDSNITAAGSNSLLQIVSGGLILNGTTAPVISSNLAFNNGTAGTLGEALVFVRGGQTGASTLSGSFSATDFTKAGNGVLLISGTNNLMAPTTTGLRNLTVQEGTLRFAGQSSVPSGGLVNLVVNNAGVFDPNGQSITVGGLSGSGSVTNSGSASTMTVNTGQGQTPTFTGTINGDIALSKTGNGTLTLSQPINRDGAPLANTYSGGTTVAAGRVTTANTVAPSGTGTLGVRNTLALGSGGVSLQGGILDLSPTGTGSLGYVNGELVDALAVVQYGTGSGLNVTVPALNNFGSANTTSAFATSLASPTAWAKVNNVTLNAPALTWAGGQNTNVLVAGTFDLTGNASSTITLNTANAGVISGQILGGGAKTINKIGGQSLIITNGRTSLRNDGTVDPAGQGANQVAAWNVAAGTLEVRTTGGGLNPLGGTNTVGDNAALNLLGATVNIRHDGDGTTVMQRLDTFLHNNVTVGSTASLASGNFITTTSSTLSIDRLAGGSNKTIQFGNLSFGGALGTGILTANVGNGYSYEFGSVDMLRDAYISPNGNFTIRGGVTGNGTLFKTNSGSLFINGDNTANFKGGTIVSGGTVFFGTFEGNVLALSDTTGVPGLTANSNLGSGNLLINPGAAIQFNSTDNIVSGWTGTTDIRSNTMGNYGILRMATNEPLSAFNVIFGNLGGPQDTSWFGLAGGNGFNGNGKTAGGSIIALNTVYTQALDLNRIGDGTAFLGSTTNGVGLNGSYNSAALGVGAGNTYRLGAGGSTLYISSDMANTNVLTGTGTALTVGLPFSGLNADNITGASGRGTVALMTANNYTGATVVNRGSVLEFRGSLTTSSFDSWGTLTAGGLGGTFMNSAGTAALAPVTLRSTSEVRFDYATGLLATNRLEGYGGQGRWDDDTAITLDNSTVRLLGNRDIEITETVGDVTVNKLGQFAVQRDLTNRTATLVIGGGAGTDLVRGTNQTVNGLAISGNNASLQFNAITIGQLGSDERIKLAGGFASVPGGITNGMVAPWMINSATSDTNNVQFLTYTAENGFVNAGFDGIRTGNIAAAGQIIVPTERTLVNAALNFNAAALGLGLDTYALRLDENIAFGSGITPAATDRIQIRSGGLITTNASRTVNTGISFGVTPQEANIFNPNSLVIGSLGVVGVVPTTGRITNATHIVKQGGGTLFIDAGQPQFNGNYIINQGALTLRNPASTTATVPVANLGGTASLAEMNAGTNGLVVLNAFGSSLNLASDVGAAVASTFTSSTSSSNITVTSATGLVVGQPISGNGIPAGARIGSISGTTVGLVDVNGTSINATVNQATAANNNFVANVGGTVSLTGATTTTGSTTVSVTSTAGLVPGMVLYGPGVNGLTVSQITSPTTFTLSAAPTTVVGSGLQLSGVVGTTAFNVGLALGDGNPYGILTANRNNVVGGITSGNLVMNGGIRFGGSPGEQGQTLYMNNPTSGTTFNLFARGGLDLGPGTIEGNPAYAFINTGANAIGTTLRIDGQVTGAATLVKTAGQTLDLNNVNSGLLNTNSGGILVQQGTFNARGTSTGAPVTGATVAASTTVTVPSTTGLVAGMLVSGPGIPAGATIATVPTGTTFTISAAATAQTGPQTLFFYSAGSLNTFASGNPNILANTTSFGSTSAMTSGGIGSGTLTLYGGTTNLRYDVGTNDVTRQRFWVGNNVAGNSLIVNGAATLDLNRNSGAYANKHLAFKDLTIGSTALSVTGGNTYVLEINGGTSLVGTPVFNVSTAPLLLNGAVTDSGAGQAIIKTGAESLWLNSNSSSFGGLYRSATSPGLGLVINGGLLRFGDVNTNDINASNTFNLDTMLGGSTVRINPGAQILAGSSNLNFGTGQIELLSSGSSLSMFRVRSTALTQGNLQNWISANSNGVIALDVVPATPLNLATIGNGTSFLGATTNTTYAFESLGIGAGNVYRLGGGGTNLNLNSTAAGNAGVLVEGATPGTRVLIGSQAANGNSGNMDSNDLFTYTGGTVISRSSAMVIREASTTTMGPLGIGGATDIFGTLQVYGNATVRNTAGTANAYSINLHPGSVLWLDNDATNVTNRWDDTTGLALNGGQLYFRARNDAAVTSTETMGAISYNRGSSIRIDRRITNGAAQLTIADLTRAGVGTTLGIQPNANFLGVNTGNDEVERILVTAWNSTPPTLAGSVSRNVTPGFAPNGILPGHYVDVSNNTFVTYNTTTGFQSLQSTLTPATNQVAYSNIISATPFTAGLTGGTAVVDVNAAAAVTLQDDPAVYALRINRDINSAVGQYNTITIGGTGANIGGLIAQGNNLAVNANLKFGASGTNEGVIYNSVTMTMNGDLTASSITKFGAGNLTIGKDQTDAARGAGNGFSGNWVVNGGTLQFNTLGGAGNGGTITLNSSSTATAAGSTLTLNINPLTPLLAQYTMGRIIAVDNAIINVDPQASDRTIGISDLEIFSTDTTGLSPARLRINVGRDRSMLNAGTLHLTGTGNSILDLALVNATNGQITSGNSTGVTIAGLNGSNNLIKWGNAALYVRGDNSTSFTGNTIIDQGPISVLHNNALGNGSITVNRYGVLDLQVAGFNKTATYADGSAERWSIDGARSGALNLGSGTLQINADQFTTNATVTLNGGGIEGFLRTDDLASANNGAVFRTLGSNVNFVFAGDSFVGQNALTAGANGIDNGRPFDNNPGSGQPDVNSNSSLTDTARGVILDIRGNISGAGSLTKQSADTVILSGTNTYGGGTNIADGTLRLGSATALPSGSNVATSGRGVLDLGGFNTSVGNLTSPITTGAAFDSSAGFITNSSTTLKTLTVIPTDDSNYGGVIQNNVTVVKNGIKKLVFTNVNTYKGETHVNGGVLEVTHVTGTAGTGVIDGIKGTSKLTVANGATFNLVTGSIGGTMTLPGLTGTVLELAGGSRLGVEVGPNTSTNVGSGTGENTGSSIRLDPGAKALVTGNVSVDAYFLPGIVTHAGKSDILVAQGGGLVSTNGSSGTYSVGNLYNVTNFTVTGITATDTLVQFNVAPATALTNAYWKGAYTGGITDTWSVSNGSSSSNWTTDLAGTLATGQVPSSITNVFLSAAGQANQNDMVLGSDMSINSLTVNASDTGTPITLNADGGHTLTIAGASAITTTVGAREAILNNLIALSAANASIAVNSDALTLNGAVSGAIITKTGTGKLTLGGANTYTGVTNVTAGVLSVSNDLGLGTTAGGTVVSAGASLELQGNITIAGEALTLNGVGASNGGALRNLSGNNIFTGPITLATASTIQSDSGTININGPIGGAFALTVEGAGNTTINSVIGTGTGTLIKNDAGILILNNANTYTGVTTVNGGTVVVANTTALGTTAGTTTVNSGGAVNISGVTVAENFTINGTGVSGAGALTGTGVSSVTGTVAMGSSSTIGAAATTDILTVGGVISGTSMNLSKAGAGTVILTGTNTYTGTTTISAGTLQVGAGSTTGSISTTGNITNNGNLVINRSDAYAVNAAQVITGTGSVQQIGGGVTTLTAAGNNYAGATVVTNGELRATVNGTSSLTVGELGGVVGTNAAILAVSGNVTGGVTVGGVGSAGLLRIGATAGAGTPGVGIPADNATLTINGTGAGALTVNTGSQLALSLTSPTIASTLTFTGGQYVFGLNTYNTAADLFGAESTARDTWNVSPSAATNHDFMNVTGGGLSIGDRTAAGGSIVINNNGGTTFAYGQVFNLMDWVGAMTGSFNLGTGFSTGGAYGDLDLPTLSGGLAWDASAFTSYGIIVVVPEPSRALLLMFGLITLLGYRRRRQ